MAVKVIVGVAWGDEGKGKCSHILSKDATVAIRATGGANAGHTVKIGDQKYAMHLLPSSILRENVKSVIAPNVKIDIKVLTEEIRKMKEAGIKVNLYISDRCRIVLPTDKEMDFYMESIKPFKVGTTGRGIGPAYASAAHRIAIRMLDLAKGESPRRWAALKENATIAANLFRKEAGRAVDDVIEDITHELNDYLECYAEELKPYICNTQQIINEALDKDETIIIEGAQALYLDLDHGDGNYVTSSNPNASGTCSGAGIGPKYVTNVVGVMKAYCSRVGKGPFQTELFDEVGDKIRELGNEYGTTTGRPRRCGWLDLVRANNAVHINGVTEWCVNHLDTIGKIGQIFGEIKVCVGYVLSDGTEINYVPTDTEAEVTPIYKTLKCGWDISGCTNYEDLPREAKDYIRFIEDYTGVKVKYIGTGPADTDVIVKE